MGKKDTGTYLIWDERADCSLDTLHDVKLSDAKDYVTGNAFVHVSIWKKMCDSVHNTTWEDA